MFATVVSWAHRRWSRELQCSLTSEVEISARASRRISCISKMECRGRPLQLNFASARRSHSTQDSVRDQPPGVGWRRRTYVRVGENLPFCQNQRRMLLLLLLLLLLLPLVPLLQMAISASERPFPSPDGNNADLGPSTSTKRFCLFLSPCISSIISTPFFWSSFQISVCALAYISIHQATK